MTKTFTIPELRMPTLEEHRAVSAKWLSRINPCLYENWPQALRDQSFRTELLELTREDQEILIGIIDNKPDALENTSLPEKITEAIRRIDPEGCFVKLSSRSPKDTFYPEVTRFRTGQEVLGSFSQSERIIDDLVQYKYADTPCYLMLREYQSIPQHQEWRCFIRDGRIAGVSQYHYYEAFAELAAQKERIAAKLFQHVESLIPLLHVQTIVVDVWLKETPLLIEINPYGLSDPCLLGYDVLETADRLFRIVEGESSSEAA